ncbi:GNAT family N-acetyltransferase [Streptomyces swartbergensis]|uniref:GNAT family N-acetyltransferase n=1 Tax=Streptomyces swartbergensis TaxID=487165 RepID=A0A243S9Q0_9ACTN|nr:GNAT family N-acetyltransferase [Streptomyces swartbergensis]OUD04358.1 GNAT family N-acetyltransferase [Streptomyces swartbergensis]
MKIEKATEADVDVLSQMLGEVEAHYGGPDTQADPEQIRAALFGSQPVATVLIARADDDVLGFASYSFLWPAAGADTSIYLKELFVREPYRRGGVAGQLMEAVREAGRAAGCSRLEWTADVDNPLALDFYKALGVQPHEGKVFYRSTL